MPGFLAIFVKSLNRRPDNIGERYLSNTTLAVDHYLSNSWKVVFVRNADSRPETGLAIGVSEADLGLAKDDDQDDREKENGDLWCRSVLTA